ncbi:MAG: CapA family protein [Chloroflexota bacterium]
MAKELTVLLVGDVNCNQPDPYSMLRHVAPVLKQGDFVLGNLEGPICDHGEPSREKAVYGSPVHHRAPPRTADALKKAGFTAVNMANNHMMDFTQGGLLQTLELLDEAGIAHVGAGRNIQEARRPVFLEKGGLRLGFLGFTCIYTPVDFPAAENKPGVVCVRVTTSYQVPENLAYSPGTWPRSNTIADPRDKEWVLDDVRRARKESDLLVVSFHWGVSSRQSAVSMDVADDFGPSWTIDYQKELGRAAVDAGASLVMGHHPARLHGMEFYKGGLICYSLGNFAFPKSIRASHGLETCIVKAYIDPEEKRFTRFSFIPARLEEEPLEVPRPVPVEQAADIIEVVNRHSRDYGTRFHPAGDEVLIEPP